MEQLKFFFLISQNKNSKHYVFLYQNLVLAKNKLRKFQQISSYNHVFEPTIEVLKSEYHLKGKWKSEVFKNNNPIILELGCGKGEYSVALAEKYPQKNLIGVDIKGARIWKGATDSLTKNLINIAFLRVRIEWIEHCFDKNEIDEIWITFPDPQLKFRRSSKRLTHPNFLMKYNKILKKSGVIHLKTDNQFLHAYTLGILDGQSHSIEYSSNDIYSSEHLYKHLDIKTYYEQKYLEKGMPITYVKFRLNY